MWLQMSLYLQNHWQDLLQAVVEHLAISIPAALLAILIAVPAGIGAVRRPSWRRWIVSSFGVLRVVPSLAILLLLIPIIGTGVVPATIALVIMAVPPILIHTVAGLDEVPDFLLETAAACGMTDRQIWSRVRIPLALPMILTGIKTAAVEILASATLAAKIGAGGLGELIFTGMGLYRIDLLLIGGGTVALLSMSTGLLFDYVDRLALRYRHL